MSTIRCCSGLWSGVPGFGEDAGFLFCGLSREVCWHRRHQGKTFQTELSCVSKNLLCAPTTAIWFLLFWSWLGQSANAQKTQTHKCWFRNLCSCPHKNTDSGSCAPSWTRICEFVFSSKWNPRLTRVSFFILTNWIFGAEFEVCAFRWRWLLCFFSFLFFFTSFQP